MIPVNMMLLRRFHARSDPPVTPDRAHVGDFDRQRRGEMIQPGKVNAATGIAEQLGREIDDESIRRIDPLSTGPASNSTS